MPTGGPGRGTIGLVMVRASQDRSASGRGTTGPILDLDCMHPTVPGVGVACFAGRSDWASELWTGAGEACEDCRKGYLLFSPGRLTLDAIHVFFLQLEQDTWCATRGAM